MNFVNDFYFNQGELFAYNDVTFTGTSSFIYRSTVPSYIMSGANLKFNPKTTFYFEPSTSGTTGLLAKDLLIMGDATSKLTLDGTALKTTLTGMRLTKGQLLLGNNVTMTSATSFRATGTSAILTLGTGIANAFREIDKLHWSPDGRKLAVAGQTRTSPQANNLAVYLFSGTTTSTLATVGFSVTASGVSWSPDGQYLAAGGKVNIPLSLTVSTSNLQIYSAANNFSSPVVQTNLGTTGASYTGPVSWSPDGHYLAVGGNMRNLTIYQFTGSALNQVSTATTAEVLGIAWHSSGKYIAIASNSATASIAVYSVTNGVLGGSPLLSRNYASGYGTSVSWSPDGNYLATTGLVSGTGTMYVYSVNSAATSSVQVSALPFGTSARTVKWSSDGRFLLVGGNDTASRDLILYIEFPSLTFIQTVSFGTYIYSTDVHPSGLYLAAGGYTPTPASYQSLSIGALAYGQETTGQAVSNSIVFGNSAVGSASDLNLQLLSGANVSVDGIVNYDNVNSTSIFSNNNASFVLKNSNSEIRINPATMLGWRDSSIVNNVSGIGLGDYNLKQYDYSTNNIITYAEVNNSMQYINWNIPANTIVHIQNNILMDGYGGTINLGANSEIFVDDNVTLTLRNVVISNTENFVGNPAIYLSSNRSKLVLDNSTLNMIGDFNFSHGQLFVNNDVKFTGTSAFIYTSPMPSFITSGGRLFFDTGTTFSVAPATFTDCPYSVKSTYTTNNFIWMADKTSKLYLNGCSFLTTLTGCRLRTGSLFFDNRVTMRSNASSDLATTSTTPVACLHGITTGSTPNWGSWSPDGRFIATVNNTTPGSLQIFRVSGAGTLTLVGSAAVAGSTTSALWSPDGRFIAVANQATNTLQIFTFSGSGNPTQVTTGTGVATGAGPWAASWSPDGRFIAVVGSPPNSLRIFSFSGGGSLTFVGSITTGSKPASVAWSPDGRFIAVSNWDVGTLQIFSFNGVGNPTQITTGTGVTTGTTTYSVVWSPDGRFIALVNLGSSTLQIFGFNGTSNPTLVGQASTGSSPFAVAWSSDGRFLAVVNRDSSTLQIFTFSGSGNPTQVTTGNGVAATGTHPYSVAWSPDGRFIALVNNSSNTLKVFGVNYIVNRLTQALTNSIVFGNSASGSASDLGVQLLSGANVSVDGILNYDNTMGYTMFSNNNASFVLKNSNSEIHMTPNTVVGWQDSSIISNVSNAGLGDYNLISDVSAKNAQIPTNLINYSGVPNTLVGSNWNIPANTIVHVSNNAVLDGNGNTVNIGANSEIFVDDTITLTLRNVVVDSTLNGPGNPAIKLASNRSQLVLDNATLIPANDFYFDRGKLFVNNDVKFTGTSALVYRSPKPLMITSGGRLFFDVNTTFSLAPATFTDCPYSTVPTTTTNNFIRMADQTSQLYLNGCSFFTTLTGLRLTQGTILLDNKVTMKSNATSDLATTNTSPIAFIHGAVTGINPYSVSWSPDGRFIAVVNFYNGTGGNSLQIFNFSGSEYLTLVGSVSTGNSPISVSWSPDGRFIAVVNKTSNTLQMFSFSGFGNPTLVGSVSTGSAPYSVSWSPDGRFIAVVNETSNTLQMFSFSGFGNPTLVGSVSTGSAPYSVSWSPDGRFIAVVNKTSNTLQMFSFSGLGNPTLVGSVSTGSAPYSVSWSPDGRFIAVVNVTSITLQIFSFYGLSPALVGSVNPGTQPLSVSWSPDGRYLAVTGYNGNTLLICSFSGSGNPTLVGSVTIGHSPYSVSWSPDGRYLAVAANASNSLQIFGTNYVVNRSTQAISNSIVFGNSAAGQTSDLNVKLLSGANVSIDGIVNYDNTLGYTMFSNDDARFVLKNSNSEIRMKANTVVGWNDRSIIKNTVGGGLGDYNLVSYAPSLNNNIVTYAAAPAELVYDNSNAIIKLGQAGGTLSVNNSNAIVKINAEMITINGPGVTQISTPAYTMPYDIYLSTDHTLNIANSCVLDGNGHMINFAKDSPNIFTTGINSNVILNNVVLKNFDDSSVHLGAGATLTFGDGCRIDLADEQAMSMPWIFSGNSAINGYGNPLDLGTQSIQIMQSGTLTIENLLLSGLVDNNVRCLGPNANITFKNDTLQITGDYSFTAGSLIFQDEVEIKSNNELSLSNEFIYASDQISTINSYSRLKLDYGVFFYYAPSVVSRNLIAMQDVSSELYLNGCALATSSVGMCLIKGTLTVDSDNQLIDVLFGTPTSLAQSICFGDATSADDLAINILPGGQLDITNGILDYQNVN